MENRIDNNAVQDLVSIPYIVYESTIEKADKQQKRLVVVIITLISLLFASNAIWLYYWNQYEYVDTLEISAEQDGEGVNIIGGGDVDYGAESESQGD